MGHNPNPGFFGQLFGTAPQSAANQAQHITHGQLSQLQNSGMSAAQAQTAINAHYQHMATQAQMAQANFKPARYMIDGRFLDFDEFIDELYPEDCPEKTMLILKLKKEA